MRICLRLLRIVRSFARTDGIKMRWLAFCGGIFSYLLNRVYFFRLIYFFGCWFFFAFHSTERNKKRDIRNWYQSANDRYNDAIEDKPRDTLRRGDIPILHGDCDGKWWPQSTLCVNAFIRSFIKLNFIGFSYLFARVKQAA